MAKISVIAASALLLTACGGNVPQDSAASSTNDSAADTAIVQQGEAAAAAAGSPVELPDKTIGFIYYGANGLASQRAYDGVKAAVDEIGWTLIECDGQGIPVEQQRCASNLLSQNIDALIVNTIESSTLSDAVSQATAADIPIISVGGSIETSEGYASVYGPDEAAMGEALGSWVVEALPDGGGVVQQTFPSSWAMQRVEGFDEAIKDSEVSVLSSFDANAGDLINATQEQTAAALSSHPDTQAFLMTFSTAEMGASQALAQQYGQEATFPDRPLLMTFYANLPVIDMIRNGDLDAAAESPVEWQGWVATDQLAEYFARESAIDTETRPNYGDGLDFWRTSVVTADNLPEEGQLLAPPVDFSQFFTTKWTTEFTR